MTSTATMARRPHGRAIVLAALAGLTGLAGVAIGARESQAQSISAGGSPPLLAVNTAAAGFAPTPQIDNSTTYTIVGVTGGIGKITAQLNAPMPAGVTLSITLGAPTGASSSGAVALGTAPQTVVTGITSPAVQTRSISYQLSATAAAGVVPIQTRTVVLTLIVLP